MNSFGTIFRIHIFGESHGDGVGIIIDGCPAGLPISKEIFAEDLARRRSGAKGTTTRVEQDEPLFISGVFNGHSTGSPLTIFFKNQQVDSDAYNSMRDIPRPGHADFTAHSKFRGYEDFRGGGHFSGRLTVCLVAAGVLAKKILGSTVEVKAALIEAGGDADIDRALEKAIAANDSIGGVVRCVVAGLPIGLGEPFFNSVESLIAHLAFAVPAIKGIEFGSGFAAARMYGSEHNDALVDAKGTTATNHHGGINGGISNGNKIEFSVAVKPTSSTPKEQRSWNNATKQTEDFQVKGRHDLCIALRVPVIMEAVAAIALCDLFLQHDGSDK